MRFSHYIKRDGAGGIFIAAMLAATVFLGFLMIFTGYKNKAVMTIISYVYLAVWIIFTAAVFVRCDKTMAKTAALILGVSLFSFLATMGVLENFSEILSATVYKLFLVLTSVLSTPVLLMSALAFLDTMYEPMLIPALLFIIFCIYLLVEKYKSRERE